MAHNFKLTGDYYVSVDGSDSNSGLTKDLPKRTIQAGWNLIDTSTNTTRNLIIGAGYYNESLSFAASTSAIKTINVQADGIVVLDGSPNKSFSTSKGNSASGASGGVTAFYNLRFRNYSSMFFIPVWGSNVQFYSQGCTFLDCDIIYSSGYSPTTLPAASYVSCMLINTTVNINTSPSAAVLTNITNHIVRKCIIINSTFNNNISALTELTSSYINYSFIAFKSSTGSNFNYNNIGSFSLLIRNAASAVTSGVIQDVYGRYYDLSIATSTGTGSIGDPFGRPLTINVAFNFQNHLIAYPDNNVNSFSFDPKFNDIESQDFTLQADSPHIGKASDSTNIGSTNYAIRHAATGAALYTDATVTNLVLSGSDLVVSGAASGEIVTAPIFYSNSVKLLNAIRYNGLLEFNKAIGGAGTAVTGNRNVPDYDIYDSTTQPPDVQGANPDRLVYKLRFSTQTNEPTLEAHWDNGGLWTAEAYETFEWNIRPSIDSATKGNGDPVFNSADTPVYLNVTWIQLKIKLRNDY